MRYCEYLSGLFFLLHVETVFGYSDGGFHTTASVVPVVPLPSCELGQAVWMQLGQGPPSHSRSYPGQAVTPFVRVQIGKANGTALTWDREMAGATRNAAG